MDWLTTETVQSRQSHVAVSNFIQGPAPLFSHDPLGQQWYLMRVGEWKHLCSQGLRDEKSAYSNRQVCR